VSVLALGSPIICIVTRGRGAPGSDERRRLTDRLAAAVRGGANMIQVRERQLDDRLLMQFVQDVAATVRPEGAHVIVNDRIDVALAAKADGVHLKSDSPAAADVRRLVPPGFIIGRSVHSPEEAAAVEAAGGCDYLLFGTVFPSPSKPGDHPVAGLDALRRVCAAASLPVVAIGGMTPGRAGEVRAAGAAGVAAISFFTDARDAGAAAAALHAALTLPRGHV